MEGNAGLYRMHDPKLQMAYHLEIPESELESWQIIVDLIAQIGGARAGLIMKVKNSEIQVLVASKPQNHPYQTGDREPVLNSGLYCERVIKEDKMLLVPNALQSDVWKNNPDMKYGMLCYLGFPIHLPDGSPFGTICILDDKENHYTPTIISLMERMRDLIEAHIKLLYLGAYDQLTGLYNRTYFYKEAEREMKRADRYHTPIAMLLLDIDHFKQVNDAFGHLTGDEVLRNMARAITSSLRGADIAARYGGEEFVVLMPNISFCKAVYAAERIRVLLENSHLLPSGKLTVSIGTAEYIHGETFDDWFKRADAALYRAKNSGRNRVMADQQQDGWSDAWVHLEWRMEWNSGNEKIDQEHRKLIELGNQLINLSLSDREPDQVTAQLELLLNHVASHFENEEKILSQIGYPNGMEHRKLHEDLIEKSFLLKESYLNHTMKQSAFFSFVVDDVIIEHMEQEDRKFFPYLLSHGGSG